MRHLALIADHVLQAAGRSGQVTAGVLRGAVERLVLQAKAMVRWRLCAWGADAELGPAPPADALSRRYGPVPWPRSCTHPCSPPTSHLPPQVHAVSDLAVLDLIVLVAAARLAAAGKEDFNFEMVRACGCMWVHVGGACLGDRLFARAGAGGVAAVYARKRAFC